MRAGRAVGLPSGGPPMASDASSWRGQVQSKDSVSGSIPKRWPSTRASRRSMLSRRESIEWMRALVRSRRSIDGIEAAADGVLQRYKATVDGALKGHQHRTDGHTDADERYTETDDCP